MNNYELLQFAFIDSVEDYTGGGTFVVLVVR